MIGRLMSDKMIDAIARCPNCRKLVRAHWYTASPLPGWRLYQHTDRQGEPYCEGGGLVITR
jgi:hypothetical protein